ncbi:hypothetical protein BJ972_003231 [Agromyces atrinae]|uniref:Uncharacterized protein n=1 Tax=Agromyces atrinae TaxID=592376 RepID=A0A852S8I7_9MICO|nr:hypothetical protein [Agromyces atrinae]
MVSRYAIRMDELGDDRSRTERGLSSVYQKKTQQMSNK